MWNILHFHSNGGENQVPQYVRENVVDSRRMFAKSTMVCILIQCFDFLKHKDILHIKFDYFPSAKELSSVQTSSWPGWDLWCLWKRYRSCRILLQEAQGIWIHQACINVKSAVIMNNELFSLLPYIKRGQNDIDRLSVTGRELNILYATYYKFQICTSTDGWPDGPVHGLQPLVIHWDHLLGHI